MESELTSATGVKALDQSVVSGATPTFVTAICLMLQIKDL